MPFYFSAVYSKFVTMFRRTVQALEALKSGIKLNKFVPLDMGGVKYLVCWLLLPTQRQLRFKPLEIQVLCFTSGQERYKKRWCSPSNS